MATSAWLLAIVLFAISTSFSPGPNNLLLVTSGAKFGLSRTWRHIMGVAFGFPVMIAIITGKPKATPMMCRQVRESPNLAPDVTRSRLLGPGEKLVEIAKRTIARSQALVAM